MKSGFLFKWVLGLSACGLCLTGGCLEKSSGPASVRTVADTEATPEVTVQPAVYEVASPAEPAPVAMPALDIVPAPSETAPAANVVTAPAQPVAAEKTLPPNVRLSGPAMEVVKLANSGVDVEVMLSYVTNSMSTFNIGADEIIYLNDIGVPGIVVSAMIQRDPALQLAAMNANAPAAQPAPAPGPPAYPPPGEVAPQAEPTAAAYPPLTPPEAAVSYDQFYSDLAPYGTWVDVAGYGRCWQPTVVVVNPGWQPYFDCGSWAYTDCGWYWHSDYSWGWAPFHYGRWFRHGHLGWCWAPDTVWGPSWVSWRHSNAYCGWAPLPPGCGFSGGSYVYHGRRVGDRDDFGLGPHDYRFVAWNDFHNRHLRGHDVPQRDASQVYKETTVVNRMVMNNKTVINQGIAPERVANATQREVPQVALLNRSAGRAVSSHGDGASVRQRTLAVYRPERPLPNPAGGNVTERSGVAIRQGQTPSAATGVAAPSAGPATRLTGEPSLTSPRPTDRTTEPLQAPRTAGRQPGAATFARELRPSVTEQTETPAPSRPLPTQTPSSPAPRMTGVPQAPTPLVTPSRPATTGRQPTPTIPSVTPARNVPTRPNWTQPATTAAPATPATVSRPNVSQATPWLDNRAVAPAPAPARPQYTPPAYVPQRTYTPPPAPSRPTVAEVPRYSAPSAPSRPAMSEAPRYSPPPAPAPTPHSSAVQTRSAPSAPQAAPDRGSSSGNSNRR